MLTHLLRQGGTLLALSLCSVLSVAQDPAEAPSIYPKQLEVHGIPILATEAVADDYLYITARVYEHMTSRVEPYDLRALHRRSGFRILLIAPDESFLDLPEYRGEDPELDEAGGLGGSIGEFHIALRVGSPHTLVHELGHGIYHSAIQFQETGGATDEDHWYRERVQAVHGMDFEEALDSIGEEQIHEVLLAEEGSFSFDLAAAWRGAAASETWGDEYAGTEPNEYWAEGVALWFRAWQPGEGDSREYLRERDEPLFKLCERVFPGTDWTPSRARVSSPGGVLWSDDETEQDWVTFDEAPNLEDFFDLLDSDGSGRLEAFESADVILALAADEGHHGSPGLSAMEVRNRLRRSRREGMHERREFFLELDRDGDGHLTRAEAPDELWAMLATADINDNGTIELFEVLENESLGDPMLLFEQELLEFFEEADQDDNGSFALDDLPADSREEFEDRFIQLDLDANGLLTRSELLGLLEEELRGATFEVRGTQATMSGVIGPGTPGRVLQLAFAHPEVETLAMLDVPGSMDDHANLRAARYVRRMGWSTHVPAGGEVASGGTDFYLAGVERSLETGARFGVHSWSGFDQEGADVPADDPEHQKYLDYYLEMKIPTDFYWFTLEAASSDDIYWMTQEDLERFGFVSAPGK